jgi:hypothetical protein
MSRSGSAAPANGSRWPILGVLALVLAPAAVLCVQLGALAGKQFIESPGNLSITTLFPGLVRASSRVLLVCVLQGAAAGIASLLLGERPRWPALLAVATFGLLVSAGVVVFSMR